MKRYIWSSLTVIILTILIVYAQFINRYHGITFNIYNICSYVVFSFPRYLYFLLPLMSLILFSKYIKENLINALKDRLISLRLFIHNLIFFGFFSTLILLFQEIILPMSEKLLQQDLISTYLKNESHTPTIFVDDDLGIIITEEHSHIRVSSIIDENEMEGITVFEYDSDRSLRSVVHSKRAYYSSGNTWNLEGIFQILSGYGYIDSIVRSDLGQWTTIVTPEVLNNFLKLSKFNVLQYTFSELNLQTNINEFEEMSHNEQYALQVEKNRRILFPYLPLFICLLCIKWNKNHQIKSKFKIIIILILSFLLVLSIMSIEITYYYLFDTLPFLEAVLQIVLTTLLTIFMGFTLFIYSTTPSSEFLQRDG